jgi:NAD(P)-dependent dehydrogenase (short-subunit alcohol dehydrogenase family)
MRILITGAGRAIGAATAAELSARSHDVVATARNLEALDSVEAARRLVMDVRDVESVKTALEQAGELDGVVNNAAVSSSGPLEDFPIDELSRLFDTNILGPLRLVQAVAPSWRERGHGVIVNVSSIQGRVSPPLGGPYAASKHALEALSETMHYELSHFGIRTVIVEPGYTAPGSSRGPPPRPSCIHRPVGAVGRDRHEAQRTRRPARTRVGRDRNRRCDRGSDDTTSGSGG